MVVTLDLGWRVYRLGEKLRISGLQADKRVRELEETLTGTPDRGDAVAVHPPEPGPGRQGHHPYPPG